MLSISHHGVVGPTLPWSPWRWQDRGVSDRALDPNALATVSDRMRSHVESGAVPGLVTLLASGDEVHVETMGRLALDAGPALERDAIFRIASLTKPITAAAAMLLVDDGVLALDEPIDSFLPELAGRRVLRSLDAALDDTVPAHRAITVDDLLTCRLGLGCIMAPPGTYPIQRCRRSARAAHVRSAVAAGALLGRRVDPAARHAAARAPARRRLDV